MKANNTQYWNSSSYLTRYQSFFCMYSWIIFALSLIAFENLRLIQTPTIYDNWNQHPIIDISSHVGSCGDGYIPILNFTYPQADQKCNCTQKTQNTKGFQYLGIYDFACTQRQLAQGCSMVDQKKIQTVSQWPFSNGSSMCYKKHQSSLKDLIKDRCNSTEQQCSSGNYKICVNQNQSCPIYSIKISQTKLHKMNITVSRNSTSSFPIFDFVIGDLTGICAEDVNSAQDGNSAVNSTCQLVDSTFTQIDLKTTLAINKVNNISNTQTNQNQIVQGLYAQSYNTFAFNMCDQGQLVYISNLQNEKNKLQNYQKFLTIVLGGFAGIYAGIIAFALGLSLIGWAFSDCRNLDIKTETYRDNYTCWIVSKWFLHACCCVIIVIGFILQSIFVEQLSYYIASSCGNESANYSIRTYQSYFTNEVHQLIMIVFFLSLMTLIGHSIVSRFMLSSLGQQYLIIVKNDEQKLYNNSQQMSSSKTIIFSDRNVPIDPIISSVKSNANHQFHAQDQMISLIKPVVIFF